MRATAKPHNRFGVFIARSAYGAFVLALLPTIACTAQRGVPPPALTAGQEHARLISRLHAVSRSAEGVAWTAGTPDWTRACTSLPVPSLEPARQDQIAWYRRLTATVEDPARAAAVRQITDSLRAAGYAVSTSEDGNRVSTRGGDPVVDLEIKGDELILSGASDCAFAASPSPSAS